MKKIIVPIALVLAILIIPQVTHAGFFGDMFQKIFRSPVMLWEYIWEDETSGTDEPVESATVVDPDDKVDLDESDQPVTVTQPTLSRAEYVSGKDAGSVYGANLLNAKIYFNGSLIPKEDYTSQTANRIGFMMPTTNPGTYPIYVTSPSGTSATVSLVVGQPVTVTSPVLTSAEYVTGKDAGSVYGANLLNAKIYFNGSLIPKEDYTSQTANRIGFMMPTTNPGTYPIYVESSEGRSGTVNLVIEE